MSCPTRETLAAFVELELEPAVEDGVRDHVDGCARCDEELRRLDPTWLFHGMPPATLTDVAWDEVMAAVRAEVAAAPRRSPLASWLESVLPTRLAPAMAAAGLGGLLLFALPAAPPPAEPVVAVAATSADERGGAPVGFQIRLDNPRAEVTHALLAGADDAAPVQLTMVIDETLEDLF